MNNVFVAWGTPDALIVLHSNPAPYRKCNAGAGLRCLQTCKHPASGGAHLILLTT